MPASANCVEQQELRDLPARGWSRAAMLFKRALLLRCPQCGGRGVFAHPWSMRDCCPICGYIFASEDGYFLGAYAINLVVAEVIGLGAVLVFLFRSDLSLVWQQVIAITAAILLPVLFYPWSRTFWMAIDLSTAGDKDIEQIQAHLINSRGSDTGTSQQ
ncbi:MAG: DUF983 domain-containing protein [Thermomicrobiales bacterium]|nr:DUF983 domain-containing protein [Thermomicrobiales bacterium]